MCLDKKMLEILMKSISSTIKCIKTVFQQIGYNFLWGISE